MVLFLRNNRFNVTLILADWGGGDYSLRNSGLPPPCQIYLDTLYTNIKDIVVFTA